MSAPQNLRLFTALPVKDDAAAALAKLQQGLNGAKWTKPENLHVTLRFIGQTLPGKLGDIRQTLASIHFAPFAFDVAGIDCWPGGILHAVVAPQLRLWGIKAAIDEALNEVGIALEDREYRPHITLARLKQSQPLHLNQSWLKEHQSLSITQVPATAFHLYESRSSEKGLQYVPLASVSAQPA
jgi:2'-5' RNA ligase